MTTQTTTTLHELAKSMDFVIFKELNGNSMEISYFWGYDLQKTEIVTRQIARQTWTNLLSNGYTQTH